MTIGSGVKYICDGAFYYCNTIVEVTLGSSVEYIGSGAFQICQNLEEIRIPASVKEIGAFAFTSCYFGSAVFEDADGWCVGGENISSELISDNERAAGMLIVSHTDYTWVKR